MEEQKKMQDQDSMDSSRVECGLCAHHCSLQEGQRGICGVRENRGSGHIESLVYGRLIAEHIDPIEKKPLFHVLPGSLSYSIATPGCNFHCLHCQNYPISQVAKDTDFCGVGNLREPRHIVQSALERGCRSLSYTYVEPTVFLEFALDCCGIAQQEGLRNIFVSNGFMSRQTREQLFPLLSAINIDLKSFRQDFYRDVCGGRLEPVLENIAAFKKAGVWVEVTTLIIPDLNDSAEELEDIAAFICSIDGEIPWHVTAFYPSYKMMDARPTPVKKLLEARQIGLGAGLHQVFTGNIPGSSGENSYCHVCGCVVIARQGFTITRNVLRSGRCPQCGVGVAGVWEGAEGEANI